MYKTPEAGIAPPRTLHVPGSRTLAERDCLNRFVPACVAACSNRRHRSNLIRPAIPIVPSPRPSLLALIVAPHACEATLDYATTSGTHAHTSQGIFKGTALFSQRNTACICHSSIVLMWASTWPQINSSLRAPLPHRRPEHCCIAAIYERACGHWSLSLPLTSIQHRSVLDHRVKLLTQWCCNGCHAPSGDGIETERV